MMSRAEARDMFGGDREQFEFGAEAGAGRPGKVIRRHPKTGARHMDWLIWGLVPQEAANDPRAPRPIHARAETIAELPVFAKAFRL